MHTVAGMRCYYIKNDAQLLENQSKVLQFYHIFCIINVIEFSVSERLWALALTSHVLSVFILAQMSASNLFRLGFNSVILGKLLQVTFTCYGTIGLMNSLKLTWTGLAVIVYLTLEALGVPILVKDPESLGRSFSLFRSNCPFAGAAFRSKFPEIN